MTIRDGDRILLKFGRSAYGPMIRICTGTRHQLKYFLSLLEGLAQGERENVTLDGAGPIVLEGVHKLTMCLGSPDSTSAIRIIAEKAQLPEFVWVNDREGWQGCCDIASPLVSSFRPAHTYLTREGVDDVLVELSYAE